MATLVTGATGRVGSRFVPRLLDQGKAVRVLVRDPEKAAALAAHGAEVVGGDFLDEDAVRRALDGVDAVVHLAAAFRGVDEREAIAVNRDATAGLTRAVLAASVGRFVYASTNLVYGHRRQRPAREDDEPAPIGCIRRARPPARPCCSGCTQTKGAPASAPRQARCRRSARTSAR